LWGARLEEEAEGSGHGRWGLQGRKRQGGGGRRKADIARETLAALGRVPRRGTSEVDFRARGRGSREKRNGTGTLLIDGMLGKFMEVLPPQPGKSKEGVFVGFV
jgi:hypothetical protein